MFGRIQIATAICFAIFASGLAARANAAIMTGGSAAARSSDQIPVPASEKPEQMELQILVADSATSGCSGAESNSLNMSLANYGLLSTTGNLLVNGGLVVGLVQVAFKNVHNAALDGLLEPPKFSNTNQLAFGNN